MDFGRIPRNEIDWFPTIDYGKCDSCDACISFCPHGVYERKEKIVVQNPYNCTVGCNGCEPVCPREAISFPSLDIIVEAKKKWSVK
ncbi:MAG: 4Fe-4S binding protein [Actinomycetota bacterium]|nr:4Fe-4S binding protein [Actinomycetota bacterium]